MQKLSDSVGVPTPVEWS